MDDEGDGCHDDEDDVMNEADGDGERRNATKAKGTIKNRSTDA